MDSQMTEAAPLALESAWDATRRIAGHEDLDRHRFILSRMIPGTKAADAHSFSAVDCMLAVLRHLYSTHPDHLWVKGRSSENLTGVAAELVKLAMSNFTAQSEEEEKKVDDARRRYMTARIAELNGGPVLTFHSLMQCLGALWETPDFDLYQTIGRQRLGVDKHWIQIPVNERHSVWGGIRSPIFCQMKDHNNFNEALRAHIPAEGIRVQDEEYAYRTHLGKPKFMIVELDPLGVKPPGFSINTIGRVRIPSMEVTSTRVKGGAVQVTFEGYNGKTFDEYCLLAIVRNRGDDDGLDFIRLYHSHGDNVKVFGDRDRYEQYIDDSWSLGELDSKYTLFYTRVGPAVGPPNNQG
ncbi:hypothetical protein N0V82_008472 [Gnomoniopsis sp. IMI 355080]|nr:hypothetical protein N0V82_008472 [Gnomoniopsis sp. IMI 355080]